MNKLWLAPLLVATWEVVTRLAEHTYFPPPSLIVARLYETWFSGPPERLFLTDLTAEHFAPSVFRLLVAWLVACAAGITLGVAIGRSSRLADYAEPLVHFGRAIPPAALLPIFLVLFSFGGELQLATIIFGVIWPILLNSIDGARYVDRMYMETCQVFKVSRPLRFFRVILPAAAPKIFAGLRLSISIALILMILSELVGSYEGLGNLLSGYRAMADMVSIWGIIVLLGLLGILLNALFLLAENWIIGWHVRSQQTG